MHSCTPRFSLRCSLSFQPMQHPACSCPLLALYCTEGLGRQVAPCHVHGERSPNLSQHRLLLSHVDVIVGSQPFPWLKLSLSWLVSTSIYSIFEFGKNLVFNNSYSNMQQRKRCCWDTVWRFKQPWHSVMVAIYFFTFCTSHAGSVCKVMRFAVVYNRV